MLGIQAMANGQVTQLSNTLFHKDYEVFKNSMVKNVALVDSKGKKRVWAIKEEVVL
jgi:hypothetical protein